MRTGRNPAPILVADTTVALDAAILGKPSDAAHAIEMLTPPVGAAAMKS